MDGEPRGMKRSLLNVFMYHRVLPQASGNAVSADTFRRQLDYLLARYKILAFHELLAYLRGKGSLDDSCAAITFDDGWRDNWTVASPILAEKKVPALLALSTDFLNDKSRTYLSRSEVEAMAESGNWSIQAHGRRHTPLTDPVETRQSLDECRRVILEITGRPPEFLFWPWGIYSRPALDVAREAGFAFTFSTEKGSICPGTKDYVLPRIGVSEKWGKFRRNVMTFRHPALAAVHSWISPSPSGLRRQ
jgi:peptidoglycan/xylan/chitin deacetylase (PgdA/CDA1 family)